MCTITKNESYNSFELAFDGKPSEEVRTLLKANGYRWHAKKCVWYGFKDISALLNGEQVTPEQAEQAKPHTSKKQLATLWERTRTDALPKYGTDNEIKKEVEKAARAAGDGYDKHAAAYMRKHLRERFPEVKFSITSGGAGYLYSADIKIKASPYALNKIKGDPNAYDWRDRYDHEEPSEELAAVLAYCEALHDVFDADDGDHYADYGAHHDLYGGASIAYNYTQTTPTEAQQSDITAFKTAKEQDDDRKKREEAQRIAEEMQRIEEARKEAAERERQEEAAAALILEHVIIEDLPEDARIIALDCACGHGKENSLNEVYEHIEPVDASGNPVNVHYSDVEIWRKVSFTSPELFGKFCNMFLRNWNFCAGMGGTTSEDVRLENINPYTLTEEQLATVHFFDCKCIGVYLNGVLQFVIDPQGFGYCRYIYIPTLQEGGEVNAKEYRKEWREKSEKLPPFYIPATLAKQLESAEINQGEEVTIFRLDDFLCMAQTIRGRVIEAKATTYAQYSDAAKFTIIPTGKRTETQLHTHKGNAFILYRGTLPELPKTLLYTPTNNPIMFLTNYAGGGSSDFINKVITYYKDLGYTPIINTIPS